MPIQITFDEQDELASDVLVVALPDHLNQLSTLTFQGHNLTELLDTYKQHHIISSEVGKVSSTRFNENGLDVRLITVGLGNLKELNRARTMEVFEKLLQTLKGNHITSADVLLQSFASKAIEKIEIAELFSADAITPTIFIGNAKRCAASIIPSTLAEPHISNFISCIPNFDFIE